MNALQSRGADGLTATQVINMILKDSTVQYGLTEFDVLPHRPDEILDLFAKTDVSGEIRYFVKCLKRGTDVQVYSKKKSNPEEIVRQLWLHKLHEYYGYPWKSIAVEHPIQFGTVTHTKAADIVVFQEDGSTAKVIIEVKSPGRREGISQLKSYLNAEGSPVGVWSNGRDKIVLYRPYPKIFEDTLTEIPSHGQEPRDVLAAKLTLGDLRNEFDFKFIIQNLEELVLANAGVDEFSEIFKVLFAKIYDEKQASRRPGNEVKFRKTEEAQRTLEIVDRLFKGAKEEWPGIFDPNEEIKLTAYHMQVVVGPLERIAILGANMRVMDDAFEYLMPTVAKKKNGQFFTPRYIIDMCVKMLNPKDDEYVIDPACGSGGFLIHTMNWVKFRYYNSVDDERFIHDYAARYLWGIDFDERSAKVSRALMLIAGDGRSHIFRVNSLDPREWFASHAGTEIRTALRSANLLTSNPPRNRTITADEAWQYYESMKFDVLLTNPPFAGEIRDRALLSHYELAKRALKRKSRGGPKEERDLLFLERCLDMLRSGGRMAIIMPQGKFNNITFNRVREWITRQARLMAVVGLHPNTFKPHTGTKTSILFLQKYSDDEVSEIEKLEAETRNQAPDYARMIEKLLLEAKDKKGIRENELPPDIASLLHRTRETRSRRGIKRKLRLLASKKGVLENLRRDWIYRRMAEALDRPVFMAVSERGGKDSSGEYIYRKDEDGSVIVDDSGAKTVDQDCIALGEGDPSGIAEHFVEWAKKQNLFFWQGD